MGYCKRIFIPPLSSEIEFQRDLEWCLEEVCISCHEYIEWKYFEQKWSRRHIYRVTNIFLWHFSIGKDRDTKETEYNTTTKKELE